MKKHTHILIASMIGNALEVYDFSLYIIFISIFATTFFPSNDPFVSLLYSFSTFSAGFVTRPIGAFIFGWVGDKYGRRPALTYSMLLGSIPMLMIGLMPSYETIGVFSSFSIVFLRITQGISFGGEHNGAIIFTLEHMASSSEAKKAPGLIGGIFAISVGIGHIMATGMEICVLSFPDISWGWRIPFILGSLVGFIGFYIRFKTTESPEFQEIKNPQVSLFKTLRDYPKSCLLTISLGGLSAISYCMLYSFFNIYLSRYLGVPLVDTMLYNLFGISIFMLSCPLFGYLSDHIEKRTYFIIAAVCFLISISLIFNLLQSKTVLSIMTAQLFLGIINGSISGAEHGFMQKLFPATHRCTGIAVNWSFGVLIFGGLAPLGMTFLIEKTGNLDIPILFYVLCVSVFMIALINLGPVTNQLKKCDEFRNHHHKGF